MLTETQELYFVFYGAVIACLTFDLVPHKIIETTSYYRANFGEWCGFLMRIYLSL